MTNQSGSSITSGEVKKKPDQLPVAIPTLSFRFAQPRVAICHHGGQETVYAGFQANRFFRLIEPERPNPPAVQLHQAGLCLPILQR